MQRTSIVAYVIALAGCGWADKDRCAQGAESCDGRFVLTCASVTDDERTWIKTRSCGLLGEGLVCRVHDEVAACVHPSADSSTPRSFSGDTRTFPETSPSAPALSSQSKRAEPEGGLLSEPRLDAARIGLHASFVRPGATSPFFRSPVFPLITAHDNVPEDVREERQH